MNKDWILDMDVAIELGEQAALEQFRWPVGQSAYADISDAVVEAFETLYLDTTLGENLRNAVAISAPRLMPSINGILVDVLHEKIARREDLVIRKSPGARTNSVVSGRSMALGRLGTLPRRIGRSVRHQRSLAGLRLKSRGCAPRAYAGPSNSLLAEQVLGGGIDLTRWLGGWFDENTGSSIRPTAESASAASWITSRLEQSSIDLDDEWTDSIRRQIERHIESVVSVALRDLGKNFEKYVRLDNSVLLVGTAGGYSARLIAHVFQRNELPVIRFSHGADRGLMGDWRWHMGELPFASMYVLHGSLEASRVRKSAETRSTTLISPSIDFVAAGSRRHQQLVRRGEKFRNSDRGTTSVERVMYMPASYLGDQRDVAITRLPDMVYLDWQVRLLKALRESGIHVTAKRHPKGRYSASEVLYAHVEAEILGETFGDIVRDADAYVFDFAASAFMEALCTGRPVVLVNIPSRPLDKDARVDLEKCCVVVDAVMDDRNRIQADLDEVVAGLNTPVNAAARRDFLEQYLLSPSGNVELLHAAKRKYGFGGDAEPG
jgi:hypothetical protein